MNYAGRNPPTDSQKTIETIVVAIIPARYNSVRLPGKALLEIAGKPMICWVAERARAASSVSRVIVATDDKRIVGAVEAAGFEAVMTSPACASGSDRVAEVAESLSADVIVNVQGDEPLVSSETIDHAVSALTGAGNDEASDVPIVTTWEPMESASDVLSHDVVKVVVDQNDLALYFSRSPVPYPRDAVRKHGSLEAALRNEPSVFSSFRKHTGLYVYRRDILLEFVKWPQSELERLESLEQLRALEHGVKIKVIKASTNSIGVDTIEDLERVRAIVEKEEFQLTSAK